MKFNLLAQATLLMVAFAILVMPSCKKDDDDPEPENPIASFQFAISETNFLEVIFTNFSQNATSYSWNFGDGNTSAEKDPTHVYDEAGNYNVTLTASNAAGTSANFSQSIEITDPDQALALLAGETSKTWKLFREGVSMSMGPNPDNPAGWWPGLTNNGARPCVYLQEFTFYRNGDYVFNDNGVFWGEFGVFNDQWNYEICFEALPENMINRDGADVSAWLSGTHSFTYDPSQGTATLTGEGAWIGIPKLATDGESIVPVSSVTFNLSITKEVGYDLMTVTFYYGDGNEGGGGFWTIVYVSYSDPSLEPDLVEDEEPWGEDLPNITPDEIFVTFAARDFENMATIDTVASGSSVIFGVDDPADAGATKVGQFIRTGGVQWQELQFRTTPELYDIQFDNFNTAKIDIYIPDDTEFTEGGLQRFFVFGFADMSQTQEWWNSPTQFFTEGDDVVLGEWTTYTFDLTEVKEREDLDMIFLGIGGGGHVEEGIFYVRNLIFE